MKRSIRQITTFCVATLAMTALSNAASVRGAAIIRQQDLEEEDDRHAPSVAPTAINDMFAQDLANSSDELPDSWEDKQNHQVSTSMHVSPTSKANVIDLPPQEATLSAAAASLDLDSAANVATSTPISIVLLLTAEITRHNSRRLYNFLLDRLNPAHIQQLEPFSKL